MPSGGRERAPAEVPRQCRVGADDEAAAFNAAQSFPNNAIRTTKYSLLSFFPRSLFEQFRRLANVYFLLVAILMVIGTSYRQVFDSPLSPYSTLGPLALVLGITMVKEGLEDLKRYRSDRAVNARAAQFLSPGGRVGSCRWDEITVGSVVRVSNRSEVPADMVVLWSSEAKGGAGGTCYIETSNIDGETNLKIREAVPAVQEACTSTRKLASIRGRFEYEQPNDRVHTFSGRLQFRVGSVDRTVAVDARNVLLRGCTLRNTRSIYGVVVYTGKDTKVMKKAGGARSKLSLVERTANRCILLIFLTQLALAVASMWLVDDWNASNSDTVPYLRLVGTSYIIPTSLANLMTYVVLYNNFIPISLYVTMEMCFYVLATFVDNDREMYDAKTDTPAACRTSTVVTDLGQIEYVLTDKTGTLTQNIMTFKMASIAGRLLGQPTQHKAAVAPSRASRASRGSRKGSIGARGAPEGKSDGAMDAADMGGAPWRPGAPDPAVFELLAERAAGEDMSEAAAKAHDFFVCMGVCHTVVAEQDEETGELEYQAESPDEGALLSACADVGFTFVSRSPSTVSIVVPPSSGIAADRDGIAEYELLGVHEFNATRKRMSVVVRRPDGQVVVLLKGADNVVFERAREEDADMVASMSAHLGVFARAGLRTLVLAQRLLTGEEAAEWQRAYHAASTAIDERERRLEAVAATVESELELLGATAIEDRLQVDVPSTIEDLAHAGIKTWVLTGDKVETAINIGYSCRLLSDDMHLIHVTSPSAATVKSQVASLGSIFSELQTDVHAFFERLGQAAADVTGTLRKLGGPGIVMPPDSDSFASPDRAHFTVPRKAVGAVSVSRSRMGRTASVDSLSSRDGDARRSGRARAASVGGAAGREREREDAEVETDSLALILTGAALEHILGDEAAEESFMAVARVCKSVVACRVSPQQKAELVRLVRHRGSMQPGKNPMCLAIGDGANDVGMIQLAQVGVGISGREGLQAVNASDFAIAQFRFLKRLLLVHGRWSYRRLSKVVLYSFYKNIVLGLTLFYYSFFTAFSGASLYESLVYSGYNFFLGWPPFVIGFMDRDLSAQTVLRHPQAYISGRLNLNLGVRKMTQWLVHAVVHSVIVFWLAYSMARQSEVWGGSGQGEGMYIFGTATYTSMIIAMVFKAGMEMSSWTWVNHAAIWVGSVAFYSTFLAVYSMLTTYAPEFAGITQHLVVLPRFWAIALLVLGTVVAVDFTVEWFRLQELPTAVDIAQEIERLGLPWRASIARDASARGGRKKSLSEDGLEAPLIASDGELDGSGDGDSSGDDGDEFVRSTRRGTLRLTRNALNAIALDMSGAARAELGWDAAEGDAVLPAPASAPVGAAGGAHAAATFQRAPRASRHSRSAFDFAHSSRGLGPGAGHRPEPIQLDDESSQAGSAVQRGSDGSGGDAV